MKKIFLMIIVLSSLISAERFTRDANGIVTDNLTYLQWQDDYSDNSDVIKKVPWAMAIAYCEALNLSGTGWRLPNTNELYNIVDYTQYDPAIDPIFQYSSGGSYWSSTTSPASGSSTESVSFLSGYSSAKAKSNLYTRTRCVRGGK